MSCVAEVLVSWKTGLALAAGAVLCGAILAAARRPSVELDLDPAALAEASGIDDEVLQAAGSGARRGRSERIDARHSSRSPPLSSSNRSISRESSSM